MPRKHRTGAHLAINHERWLVSYADFITLLFAFFVVMYSVSQVSEEKYRVLSETLTNSFRYQNLTPNPIQAGQPSLDSAPSVIDAPLHGSGEQSGDGAFEQQVDLPHMAEQLRQTFGDLIEREWVSVTANEDWLEIALKSQLLFDSASAEPNDDAKLIFSELAKILASGQYPIEVEGHTDNQPIITSRYPSNWELSAARASAAVKLLAEGGVAPNRLAAIGYGEFQPIADNTTEAGRSQNRRVAVMVSRGPRNRPSVPMQQVQDEALPQSSRPRETSATDSSGESGSTQIQLPSNGQGLQAIKLKSGGLLFTSDPERIKQAQEANRERQ